MTTFTSEDLQNAVPGKSQDTFDVLKQSQLVAEAPYHPGYEDAVPNALDSLSDKDYEVGRYLGDSIRFAMKRDRKRFWAGDNISDYLHEGDKERLIDEATEAFELVLDRLLIDRENDPKYRPSILTNCDPIIQNDPFHTNDAFNDFA